MRIEDLRTALTSAIAANPPESGTRAFKERVLSRSAEIRVVLVASSTTGATLLQNTAAICRASGATCLALLHRAGRADLITPPPELTSGADLIILGARSEDIPAFLRRETTLLVFEPQGSVCATAGPEKLAVIEAAISELARVLPPPPQAPSPQEAPRRTRSVVTLPELQGRVHKLDGSGTTLRHVAAGRPLLAIYWATYCQPCLDEIPLLRKLHKRFGKPVTFVGIATQAVDRETRGLVIKVAREKKMPKFLQLIEEEGKGTHTELFENAGIPALALFDRDGRLIHAEAGALTEQSRFERWVQILADIPKR